MVLDSTIGRVKTRKLERILDSLPEFIYRVYTRPLKRRRAKQEIDVNVLRIRSRTLKRLGHKVPDTLIGKVKTRVRNRIKYSSIGDVYSVVVKTRKLPRKTRLIAVGTAIRVETRPLRRLIGGVITGGIKIPVTAIRILAKPGRAILGAVLRVTIRALKRRSKLIKKLDVNIRIAARKIRTLRRRAVACLLYTSDAADE